MRIAVITTSYPTSAADLAGHFVRSEACRLVRAGHDVTVFAPTGAAPNEGPEGPNEPYVHWIPGGDAFGPPGILPRLRARPWRAGSILRFLWSTGCAIDRLGPFEKLIAHWLVPSGWPVAASFATPAEVVIHGSDVRLLERLPHALGRAIVRTLSRGDGGFRFVSRDLLERLERLSGIDLSARASVKPCALDVDGVPPRAKARRELDIDASETLVVLVGRLIAGKRLHIGLAGVTLLPESTLVVVVGDGPERSALEKSFPSARFVGKVPRPLALTWIAAADVLVSTSLDEGAPTAIREARSLGVEVVASRCGDLIDWAASDSGLHVIEQRPRGGHPLPRLHPDDPTLETSASNR